MIFESKLMIASYSRIHVLPSDNNYKRYDLMSHWKPIHPMSIPPLFGWRLQCLLKKSSFLSDRETPRTAPPSVRQWTQFFYQVNKDQKSKLGMIGASFCPNYYHYMLCEPMHIKHFAFCEVGPFLGWSHGSMVRKVSFGKNWRKCRRGVIYW